MGGTEDELLQEKREQHVSFLISKLNMQIIRYYYHVSFTLFLPLLVLLSTFPRGDGRETPSQVLILKE